MASSGRVSTNPYTASSGNTLSVSLDWTSEQNIASNSTTIYWELVGTGSITGYTHVAELRVTIDNNEVYYRSYNEVTNCYVGTVLASGQTTVYHNSDGTKNCSFLVEAGIHDYAICKSGSSTVALDTIARVSTCDVSKLTTLGTAGTITVSRESTSLSHKLTYSCGNYSGYILGSASATSTTVSQSWTPPYNLANTNTSGTTISVTFTLTTYSGSTAVGSKTYTKTLTIPNNTTTKPSVSTAVSDATGYTSTYGSYIQLQSKVSGTITASGKYGATISSYSTVVDGTTYSGSKFTSNTLNSSGTVTVKTTVRDSRGFTNTYSVNISVTAYAKPTAAVSVHRCNADGTENMSGKCISVTYAFGITSLNSKNTKAVTVYAKKSSSASFTTISSVVPASYSSTGTTLIISAIGNAAIVDDSSYDIKVTVTDAFTSTSAATSASTAFTMLHYSSQNIGMGRLYSTADPEGLQIGFDTRFYGDNAFEGSNVFEGSVTFQGQVTFADGDTELFLSTETNGSSGNVTLSENASNFESIEVFYCDNNGRGSDSVVIYKPEGKQFCPVAIEPSGSSSMYFRRSGYTISGNVITYSGNGNYTYFNGSTWSATSGNYIRIVRVVGHKRL